MKKIRPPLLDTQVQTVARCNKEPEKTHENQQASVALTTGLHNRTK